MDNLKKYFFILFIVALVVGSGVGGFYLIKKYISPQYPNTPIAEQEDIPGMTRDSEGKIPGVFPEGLVNQTDVQNIIESYTVTKTQSKTQITFRYISAKNISDSSLWFKKYLSTNGWRLIGTLTETDNFTSLSSAKGQENVFITINNMASMGVIVDVTYVK